MSRGRPADKECSKDKLRLLVREFALETDELLNYSILEKMSGERGRKIERRNWTKVKDLIDSINQCVITGNPDNLSDVVMPAPETLFDQYYGKSKPKLLKIFLARHEQANTMTAKCLAFDEFKRKQDEILAQKNHEIEMLKEKLKQTQTNERKYRNEYEKICGESYYGDKREELKIKMNVVEMKGRKTLDLAIISKEDGDIL